MKRAWAKITNGEVKVFCEFHECVLIFKNLIMIVTNEKNWIKQENKITFCFLLIQDYDH